MLLVCRLLIFDILVQVLLQFGLDLYISVMFEAGVLAVPLLVSGSLWFPVPVVRIFHNWFFVISLSDMRPLDDIK